MPPFLTSPMLHVPHGFFGRAGGVSIGPYDSLNGRLGSDDDAVHVAENRRRMCEALGATHLQSIYQVHGSKVQIITAPLNERPEADGMVTNVPGIALGVLAADCNPMLFADTRAGIIGACHAGWRGALAGVAQNTIKAMEILGARDITAVLGPAIQQKSYEVGTDVLSAFISQKKGNGQFFAYVANDKYMLDLPGYLEAQLIAAAVQVDRIHEDTYSQPEKYFSYRRATHNNEPRYGCQVSAILLK